MLEDKLAKRLAEHLNHQIYGLREFTSGKMRQSKGKMLEEAFGTFVFETWKIIGGDPRRMTMNDTKIPYLYKPGKSGISYKQIPPKNKSGIGLDKFIYIDGILVGSSEIKAYCDFSMYKRTHCEFESLCAKDPTVSMIIFQAENGLGGKVHRQTVFDVAANPRLLSRSMRDYREDRGNICKVTPNPTILTLTENVRSFNKEISKKKDPITAQRVGECIEFLKRILGEYV